MRVSGCCRIVLVNLVQRRISNFFAGQHCLIYWEGEQSVSVKPVSSVRNCILGELGLVDNKYKGKVIGLGKCGNTAGS